MECTMLQQARSIHQEDGVDTRCQGNKGSLSKNIEYEALNASVVKYGKEQWPRVVFLLLRKSSEQCNTRCGDKRAPAINKTEWIRDEERKLLHLAKKMPATWKTIYPTIGISSAQCISHYDNIIYAAGSGRHLSVSADASSGAGSPLDIEPARESRQRRDSLLVLSPLTCKSRLWRCLARPEPVLPLLREIRCSTWLHKCNATMQSVFSRSRGVVSPRVLVLP